MSEELEILGIVTKGLDKAGIPYMVTGSVALSFYAMPRMTRDIDIVLQVKPEDAERITSIFAKDFYVDPQSVREAIRKRDMFNMIHNQSVMKVDFIIRKNDSYRKLEFERRKQVNLGEMPVWIVRLEDLILSKLFWAKDSLSEMQLTDVRNLLRVTKELDKIYLEKWIEALDLQTIYKRVTP